jgi:SWI/SNF-related matrix-associated actin-dependent regulator of chromatin subfamily A3
MATHAPATPTPSLANLSLSSYNQSNPIDLTLDDDEPNDAFGVRLAKRPRTEISPISRPGVYGSPFSVQNGRNTPTSFSPASTMTSVNDQSSIPDPLPSSYVYQGPTGFPQNPQSTFASTPYRPNFAGPSQPNFLSARTLHAATTASPRSSSPHVAGQFSSVPPDRQVIDLTGSPSPPPTQYAWPGQNTLPNDLAPKTPVCIGLLTVTALVLYPIPYLYPTNPNSNEAEWVPVRLHYEYSQNKPGGADTIHIKVPGRLPNGETVGEEGFGVVEQKVSSSLGPMLSKGLIRLDAKIRRGVRSVSPEYPFFFSRL